MHSIRFTTPRREKEIRDTSSQRTHRQSVRDDLEKAESKEGNVCVGPILSEAKSAQKRHFILSDTTRLWASLN